MRWGVERRKPAPQSRRARSLTSRSAPPFPPSLAVPPPPLFLSLAIPLSRHSSFSVIPARPFRHSCVGRNARSPRVSRRAHAQPLLQFIPPPFQGGGEVGGGTPQASTAVAPRPDRSRRVPLHHSRPPQSSLSLRYSSFSPFLSLRHSCAPLSSFLRRQERGLQRRYAPQHPDGLTKWLSSAVGDAGRGEAWSRAGSCLRRNDG